MKLLTTLLMVLIIQFKTYRVSWYGGKHHGRITKSGAVFDKNKMTCAASKKFKIGDKLEVVNKRNDKKVVVVVTDRGNFERLGRVLDLSEGAFKRIEDLRQGVADVTITKLN